MTVGFVDRSLEISLVSFTHLDSPVQGGSVVKVGTQDPENLDVELFGNPDPRVRYSLISLIHFILSFHFTPSPNERNKTKDLCVQEEDLLEGIPPLANGRDSRHKD